MMNGILLGALVLFIGFTFFLGVVVIFPSAEELTRCYKDSQTAISNYEVRARVLEWTDEEKCIEEKKVINTMNACFLNINQRIATFFLVNWVDIFAKYISKVDLNREQIEARHNQACAYYEY